jgi:hypothetical protein
LRCFFLFICICILVILALITGDHTGFQVKPLETSHVLSSPAEGADVITHVVFFAFIHFLPAATWHPEMMVVICAMVVFRDVVISASNLRFVKGHFGGHIIEKNGIVNTCCFLADDHGTHWVRRLLDLMHECSKNAVILTLLAARW